jgi:small subunit ribosomal protein S18
MKKKSKAKQREAPRRTKKKISLLVQEDIDYIDWKDVNLLRRFMSDRAKIRARRVTGNTSQQQKQISMAIKNAREMALLPYTSRVTTQRGGRKGRDDDRGDRGDRRPRRDGPREFEKLDGDAPKPDAPKSDSPATDAPAPAAAAPDVGGAVATAEATE